MKWKDYFILYKLWFKWSINSIRWIWSWKQWSVEQLYIVINTVENHSVPQNFSLSQTGLNNEHHFVARIYTARRKMTSQFTKNICHLAFLNKTKWIIFLVLNIYHVEILAIHMTYIQTKWKWRLTTLVLCQFGLSLHKGGVSSKSVI